MTALTRKDCEDQLPPGTDPLVAAMHVAATSGERAASRREAVTAAVTAWLGAEAQPGLIAAALSAELGGVGGRMGIGVDGGGTTARMRWARSCGKGRRFATDGAAWDRAMEDVLLALRADVSPAWLVELAERCDSSDIAWPLAYCLRRAYEYRDTPPVASGWAAAGRQIASQCEPDTYAGRLASRYDLPTRRLLLAASMSVPYWDDVESDLDCLMSEGAALDMVEEVVEDFTGADLWEVPGMSWEGQEWKLDDGSEAALSITRSLDLRCFTLTIRSRSACQPACIQAVRAAWLHRVPGAALETEIITAHEALTGMHPGVLREIRAQWDAEAEAQP